MINLSPPKFFTNMFPGFIWSIPNENNNIYLTFDDGPTETVTPWVLDLLAKHNVKATFFCLGKKVEMHPEIFERIKNEGHAVGNHSYSHLKGWETPTGQYIQDVDFANDLIGSKLFRPPYGRIKPAQSKLLRERYKIIMWDLLSMDYSRNTSRRRCANIVKNGMHSGAIIVFHDSKKAEKNLRYALPRVLEEAKNKGFKFDVIK
ncbi:MAG TPA: polysaccharide deacetylase family protein [Tenuifilaceae bacterium]|nr:polysaccharide deacetylase family protein [Tenuifilaceae bacterium]HPE19197.1 polysaccharide deacetylase family protein [Tenuifilaceae bacterium]HPJ45744.1 polysaccharide deacetylase family protein [Tenuifilaceae bacterium]HPQ33695.1 polysaccharide deacetylase family protein [Tenuifilaceae bacterium]HRX68883.1 polysaccharide deacetylase family protein [Tenuifilaceae bacterium]